jgi:hypothetical protein
MRITIHPMMIESNCASISRAYFTQPWTCRGEESPGLNSRRLHRSSGSSEARRDVSAAFFPILSRYEGSSFESDRPEWWTGTPLISA